jgi:PhzF family phenazine biosynthesis protein
MQNVASEMNLSETAFVKKTWNNNFEIRFYTPSEEIDLCGHASLSTAHILYSYFGYDKNEKLTFKTKWWELVISLEGWMYKMIFPLRTFEDFWQIEQAESITEISNIQEVYDTEKKWKIFLLDNKESLQNLNPNFTAMKWTDFGNVVCTCPWDGEYDYYMRCFVTDCGINEDPVTGSIECALAPYWSLKLWKSVLKSFQLSQRTWVKYIELSDNSLSLSGQALTIFELELI